LRIGIGRPLNSAVRVADAVSVVAWNLRSPFCDSCADGILTMSVVVGTR